MTYRRRPPEETFLIGLAIRRTYGETVSNPRRPTPTTPDEWMASLWLRSEIPTNRCVLYIEARVSVEEARTSWEPDFRSGVDRSGELLFLAALLRAGPHKPTTE